MNVLGEECCSPNVVAVSKFSSHRRTLRTRFTSKKCKSSSIVILVLGGSSCDVHDRLHRTRTYWRDNAVWWHYCHYWRNNCLDDLSNNHSNASASVIALHLSSSRCVIEHSSTLFELFLVKHEWLHQLLSATDNWNGLAEWVFISAIEKSHKFRTPKSMEYFFWLSTFRI